MPSNTLGCNLHSTHSTGQADFTYSDEGYSGYSNTRAATLWLLIEVMDFILLPFNWVARYLLASRKCFEAGHFPRALQLDLAMQEVHLATWLTLLSKPCSCKSTYKPKPGVVCGGIWASDHIHGISVLPKFSLVGVHQTIWPPHLPELDSQMHLVLHSA